MSAAALGFGILGGIAIGNGAVGTLASAVQAPFTDDQGGGDTAAVTPAGPSLGSPVGNAHLAASSTAPAPAPAASTPAAAPLVGPTPTTPVPATPPSKAPPSNNPGNHHHDPPPPAPTTISGTVVHLNPGANSYTVATAEGTMAAVHAPGQPQAKRGSTPEPGDRVKVEVRVVYNGTYAETSDPRTRGTSDIAQVSGTVTFRDP